MSDSKADAIPEHRTAYPLRSGDTVVIGSTGKARNVDRAARLEASEKAEPVVERKPTASETKTNA